MLDGEGFAVSVVCTGVVGRHVGRPVASQKLRKQLRLSGDVIMIGTLRDGW